MIDPDEHCRRIKAIHAQRRKKKRCIQNASHGKAYKGGRCRACWVAKLESDKRSYQRRNVYLNAKRRRLGLPVYA